MKCLEVNKIVNLSSKKLMQDFGMKEMLDKFYFKTVLCVV
jgi:hypothetical protein